VPVAARAAPSQAPPVYHPLEGVGRSRLPELLLAAAVPSLRGSRDAAVVAVRRQPGTSAGAWAFFLVASSGESGDAAAVRSNAERAERATSTERSPSQGPN